MRRAKVWWGARGEVGILAPKGPAGERPRASMGVGGPKRGPRASAGEAKLKQSMFIYASTLSPRGGGARGAPPPPQRAGVGLGTIPMAKMRNVSSGARMGCTLWW